MEKLIYIIDVNKSLLSQYQGVFISIIVIFFTFFTVYKNKKITYTMKFLIIVFSLFIGINDLIYTYTKNSKISECLNRGKGCLITEGKVQKYYYNDSKKFTNFIVNHLNFHTMYLNKGVDLSTNSSLHIYFNQNLSKKSKLKIKIEYITVNNIPIPIKIWISE